MTTNPVVPVADTSVDVRHAVRVALAVGLCFVLVDWWQLPHANLAVWTTYMVMAQWTFTIFQKGIERIVGRALGILAGLLLVSVVPDNWLVRHFIEVIFVTALFYLYFANWLAYTFLNAGLYLIAAVALGLNDPATAPTISLELFVSVVVGVAVADVVVWLTGVESDLHIQPPTNPLLPIRADWLNHSLMLTASAMFVLVLTQWLDLPTEKAVISIFMISMTAHVQAALLKGKLRLLGAGLAIAWAGVTFVLVSRVPHFLVLWIMLVLGTLLAAYLTRVGGANAYAGVQMGLVLPLLLVVPVHEFGDVTSAWQRIEGILVALVAALLIGSLWPNFPHFEQSAPEPAQR